MTVNLQGLAALRRSGKAQGITSICSAHPLVLRAALRFARNTGSPALIEATCNQVNHEGGYTGLTPADFAALVRTIAREEQCAEAQLVLGGDHLGPNPWRRLPAEQAMTQAEAMVAAYVRAGFSKLHLDASMGCAGEPPALDDDVTAGRAARLAHVAEATARSNGLAPPVYVIGTEVPPPGGADHVLHGIAPTSPQAARETLAVHRRVFAAAGLDDAFSRAIALVVQPGVEFGNHNVLGYDSAQATTLSRVLDDEQQFVFEAHSTDYQSTAALAALVRDGFPILKVGPELTFDLREALYGLDLIASTCVDGYGERPLFRTMEQVMLAEPGNWQRHYGGDAAEQKLLRHYSLSDRIRYYWPAPAAQQAVNTLFAALSGFVVPAPVFQQFLPAAAAHGGQPLNPHDVVIGHVARCIARYHTACHPNESEKS